MELRGAAFEGTAEAFLDQVRRSQGDDVRGVSGSRAALTTDAGVVGVAQSATGPGGVGPVRALPGRRDRTAAQHHAGRGTVTDVAAGKAARLVAIEQSGWGLPLRFLQPHNAAFRV